MAKHVQTDDPDGYDPSLVRRRTALKGLAALPLFGAGITLYDRFFQPSVAIALEESDWTAEDLTVGPGENDGQFDIYDVNIGDGGYLRLEWEGLREEDHHIGYTITAAATGDFTNKETDFPNAGDTEIVASNWTGVDSDGNLLSGNELTDTSNIFRIPSDYTMDGSTEILTDDDASYDAVEGQDGIEFVSETVDDTVFNAAQEVDGRVDLIPNHPGFEVDDDHIFQPDDTSTEGYTVNVDLEIVITLLDDAQEPVEVGGDIIQASDTATIIYTYAGVDTELRLAGEVGTSADHPE